MTEMDVIDAAVDVLVALDAFDLASSAKILAQIDTISDLLDAYTDGDIDGLGGTCEAEHKKGRNVMILLTDWMEANLYLRNANGSLPTQAGVQ